MPMTAVIGKNGVGKSALFDAYGFLADALKSGVEEACDARGRGGFEKLRTQGQTGSIGFEVYYKAHANVRPITYEIEIKVDKSGRPSVVRELMHEARENDLPLCFLMLNQGRGPVWKGNQAGGQVDETAEGFNSFELERIDEKIDKRKKMGRIQRCRTHRIGGPSQARHCHAWRVETAPENRPLFAASSRDGI